MSMPETDIALMTDLELIQHYGIENERLRRTVHAQAREIAELKRQLTRVVDERISPR